MKSTTIGLILATLLLISTCSTESQQEQQQRPLASDSSIQFPDESKSEPRAYTPDVQLLDFVYHNHEDMTRFLRATSARYPNLTALYSIGKSVQGRDLWVMVVSASPYEHMIGKPDVKYIANIHGNEAVGRELMLHLIQYFVTSYNTDPYIKWLLENTRIHILPSLNPDGFAQSKEGTCDSAQGR